MTAFKIEVKDGEVLAALNRLAAAALRPEPALRAIGEALYRQTRRTFETSTDPWGRRWKPNSQLTYERFLAGKSGAFSKKTGKITKKGAGHAMAKKPLIGEGRFLSGPSLHYHVAGGEMTLGSSAVYAAIHQFGARAGEFGRYYQLSRLKYGEGDFRRYAGMRQGHPIPWGDIPARPFLPVDAAGNLAPDAQRTVVDVIQEYLLGAAR